MRVGEQIKLAVNISKEDLECYVYELNRELKEKEVAKNNGNNIWKRERV